MQQRGKIVATVGILSLLGIALYVGVQGGLFNVNDDLETPPSAQGMPGAPEPEALYYDAAGNLMAETEPEEPATAGGDLMGVAAAACPPDVTFHYTGGNITVVRTVRSSGLKEIEVRADLLEMLRHKVSMCGDSLKSGFILTCGKGCQRKGSSNVTVTQDASIVRLVSAGPVKGKMKYVYEVSADCTKTMQCEVATGAAATSAPW